MWQSHAADSFNVFIVTEGPSGSGRFWNVTIGLADSGQKIPNRGVCLYTSTIGWRTLQSFKKLPLPWIDDIDKNGKPELIIWDSFALHTEATNAEFGLIAWIYEYNEKNTFNLNWNLTKEIVLEITTAYRKPIFDASERITNIRQKIVTILDLLLSEQTLNK